MNIVIVDDEPLARKTIETIILESFPDINIVGQAGSVEEAVPVIKNTNPDLLFLDVDLTDGYGFDILSILKPFNFKVIFITAHQEYAIKAIKFSALDFILKPISEFELIDAVKKAYTETDKNDKNIKWDALFNNIYTNGNENKKIVLKTSNSIHLIKISDIIRIEADNNYSTFFLQNGDKVVVSKGLIEYEKLLNDYGFFRVHQSHLINLSYISRFDKKDGGYVVLSDKSQVPVSQRKKQKILAFFERIG
jgi:two-component system LytT family response regulator